MKNFSIIFAFIAAMLTSCVPLQRFNEQEQTLQYYKNESLASDSLRSANQLLINENEQADATLSDHMRQLERLTATNVSLNKSYQEMVNRYNQLVTQNQETLSSSSTENLNLQNQLAARQAELENKERMLSQIELQLRAREQEVQRLEGNTGGANGAKPTEADLVARTPAAYSADEQSRLAKIEGRIDALEARRFALKSDLERAMYGFTSNEIGFMERDGDIVVILYQDLLSGSTGQSSDIRWRDALQRLTDLIQRYVDFNIAVEGHAYSEGNADRSWDLSTTRAANVVKSLTAFGADPRRLAAAGRGLYMPVLPNDSPANVARNQRTEIIFIPNWHEFYRVLNE